MKVAIMQPYFIPYLGYWQLMKEADVFVLFDIVKFQKRSWMPRNRVLHPDQSVEFNYIKLVCSAGSSSLISDVSVSLDDVWLKYIRGVLSVYRRMQAKNFKLVDGLFEKWSRLGTVMFSDFIYYHIQDVMPLLGIKCQLLRASEVLFDRSSISRPGEWALQISKSLNSSFYVNPYGGSEIFDSELYASSGIELRFLKPNFVPYFQGRRENFVEGLSIIDMLMFCDFDFIDDVVSHDYFLLKKEELIGL